MSFRHQEKDHSGIKVASARSHHETASRSKPHASIKRRAVLQRNHAGAIPQVRDNCAFAQLFPKFAHNVFIGKAMKPVSSDSLVPQLARKRESLRNWGHAAVKGSIKTGHLWQLTIVGRNSLNYGELAGKMKRREGNERSQCRFQLGIYQLR